MQFLVVLSPWVNNNYVSHKSIRAFRNTRLLLTFVLAVRLWNSLSSVSVLISFGKLFVRCGFWFVSLFHIAYSLSLV